MTGVDTTRTSAGTGRLHASLRHPHGNAAGGTEWILERAAHARRDVPYTVTARADANSAIPRHGVVLSYGGDPAAPPLSTLAAGASVRLVERWIPASGRHADEWRDADDVVNGAGVLIRDGKVAAWSAERLRPRSSARHPRTIVGVDRAGDVWLATIDGRQPGYSVGMTLEETQRFALALGLTEALNLDGGGSTTMVIRRRRREPSFRSDRTASGQRRAARAATARPACHERVAEIDGIAIEVREPAHAGR